MGGKVGIDFGRPALVGIHDQARLWGPLAHGFQPWHIVGRAEFQFQQGPVRVLGGMGAHGIGRVQRQGVGDLYGMGLGQARQLPHTLVRRFRLKIPQRAVQCIPCSPCG